MVADAVRWLCRSPRRLAVAIGGLVLLVVIGATMISNRDGGGSPAAQERPAVATPPAGAAATPDAQPFADAAFRFVAAWAVAEKGETAAAWHRRVDPLATPDLSAALAGTDLAALPGSPPQGRPAVQYVAADSAMVAVPLQNGARVLVTVVSGARSSLLVSDVQPDVGDYGDTGEIVPTEPATPTPSASRSEASAGSRG